MATNAGGRSRRTSGGSTRPRWGNSGPFLARIEATDQLIDAIVYRLYGLSAEEIEIVEERLG